MNNTFDFHSDEVMLPIARVHSFRNAIDVFLANYTWLAACSDARGQLLFNVTPKFHWLWHLGERSMYLHPRRAACMIDEDFVGVMKEVVRASSAGTKGHKVQMTVCDKYRFGMAYR